MAKQFIMRLDSGYGRRLVAIKCYIKKSWSGEAMLKFRTRRKGLNMKIKPLLLVLLFISSVFSTGCVSTRGELPYGVWESKEPHIILNVVFGFAAGYKGLEIFAVGDDMEARPHGDMYFAGDYIFKKDKLTYTLSPYFAESYGYKTIIFKKTEEMNARYNFGEEDIYINGEIRIVDLIGLSKDALLSELGEEYVITEGISDQIDSIGYAYPKYDIKFTFDANDIVEMVYCYEKDGHAEDMAIGLWK